MAEAKDIDDSLDFLRYFEKYTENPDLGTLIQEKISADKKSLELSGCKLKEEDFKVISGFHPIKNLKHLNLNQTGLNSAGLQPLCTSDSFSNLESLTLANNNLDDEAIFFLSKCLSINHLESLDLSSNELGSLGAKVLSMAAGLGNLKRLLKDWLMMRLVVELTQGYVESRNNCLIRSRAYYLYGVLRILQPAVHYLLKVAFLTYWLLMKQANVISPQRYLFFIERNEL